jgi:hypothetical protein
VQNLPAAPQAANFATVSTAASCGACHDDVNFMSGLNHGGGAQANDTQCAVCHGPASTIGLHQAAKLTSTRKLNSMRHGSLWLLSRQ